MAAQEKNATDHVQLAEVGERDDRLERRALVADIDNLLALEREREKEETMVSERASSDEETGPGWSCPRP